MCTPNPFADLRPIAGGAEPPSVPFEPVTLRPVDAAGITIVVDNFVDMLLPDRAPAKRPPRPWDVFERPALRAEHGYSLLLTVRTGDRTESILYDAGVGRDTALHNLDVLDRSVHDLRAIVLSHGHADHHGGLEGMVRRVGRRGLPLLLHPDAWRDRKVVFPTGAEVHLPPPNRADLTAEGVEIVEERGPSLLIDGTVLVTGQVARTTEFEKGFPPQQARTDGDEWEPDPWLWDDQAVVVNVRDQGLVVLSACSHAGAVNILRHVRRVTGVDRVHAFIGGLHLSGALFEPIIGPTVEALTALAPEVIVPGHCSGFRAIGQIAGSLPDAFIQASAGTHLAFEAASA